MRNRLLGLIFISFMIISGCAKPPENSITFAVGGSPNEVTFWEEIIQEFEEETGITVNLQRQPTDTDQRRQGLIIPLQAKKK
ncbi:MAG: ABC transporter substrate-binding protein, partial [bacterium]|nr:ABC transporter substrate-binding protein [bacterium]